MILRKDEEILADWSNRGWNTIDIVAPGEVLNTTYPVEMHYRYSDAGLWKTTGFEGAAAFPKFGYLQGSGTSLSAALVGAAAALVKATRPGLDSLSLKNLLISGGRESAGPIEKTKQNVTLDIGSSMAIAIGSIYSNAKAESPGGETSTYTPTGMLLQRDTCLRAGCLSGFLQVSFAGPVPGGDEYNIWLEDSEVGDQYNVWLEDSEVRFFVSDERCRCGPQCCPPWDSSRTTLRTTQRSLHLFPHTRRALSPLQTTFCASS